MTEASRRQSKQVVEQLRKLAYAAMPESEMRVRLLEVLAGMKAELERGC